MPSLNPGPNVQTTQNYTAVMGAPLQQGTSVTTCETYGASPNASGQANVAAIQAALNNGGYISLTTPGTYNLLPASQSQTGQVYDWAMHTVPDNTTIYIGPQVTLLGPGASQSNSRAIFCNSNLFSNAVSVTSVSSALGTGNNVRTLFITFQTATPHGFVPGQYVCVKGDTSAYGYNKTWLVTSVTTNTFTVPDYYLETTLPLVGTVIAYAANSNIRIICDGTINMQQNSNLPPWMTTNWSGYTRAGFIFNKCGRVQFEGNFYNNQVCAVFGNCDDVIVDRCSHIDGALGIVIDGGTKKATIKNVIGYGTEECVFVKTCEPTSTFGFLDQNGTINSRDNVGEVVVDGLNIRSNIVRAMCILACSGFTIGKFKAQHIVQRFAPCPTLVVIGDGLGTVGIWPEIDVSDVNCTPNYNATAVLSTTGVSFQPQTNAQMQIGRLRLDRWNVRGGDGCSGYPSQTYGLVGLSASSSACSIQEATINDTYVDIDTTTVGGGFGTALFSGTGWTVGEVQAKNFLFNCIGANSNGGIGIGTLSAATIVRVNSCKGLGANANTPIVYLNSAGHTVYATDCTGACGNCAIVYTVGNTTARLDHCQATAANARLIRIVATTSTFNLGFADCDTTGVFFGGLSNSQTNVFNVVSGGGNKTTGATWYDVVTGSTFNFSGDCSDWHGDITAISRTAGAIFFNTNASAGTLVQNNLAVCDATGAANSWHQMTVPTNVY